VNFVFIYYIQWCSFSLVSGLLVNAEIFYWGPNILKFAFRQLILKKERSRHLVAKMYLKLYRSPSNCFVGELNL
jgi:hypothetical protein